MADAILLPRQQRTFPRLSVGRAATYLVLILGAIACLMPFVYMVMTSFKTYGDVVGNNFWPWPPIGNTAVQVENYPTALQQIGFDRQIGMPLFVRYLANSVFVTGSIVVGTLVTSVLAAYALAKLNLPGKNLLFVVILAIIMVPEDATLVPKVVMIYNLHWYNTYWAL